MIEKDDYRISISGGYKGIKLKVVKNTSNSLKLEDKSGVYSYGQFEIV